MEFRCCTAIFRQFSRHLRSSSRELERNFSINVDGGMRERLIRSWKDLKQDKKDGKVEKQRCVEKTVAIGEIQVGT